MSFTHGDFDYDYLRRLALVPVDANTNGNDNINNEIEYDYDYDRRRFRPRFKRLDFAVHFDIGMRGRRGTTMTTITTDDEDNNKVTTKLTSEKQLTPFRQRFVDMFVRLRREHGVHFYLAHNMTVQPDNLDSVKDAVRDLVAMGFRLISFQPAALQGARRVTTVRDAVSEDDNGEVVWTQLEQGLGLRLPYSLFQMGDVRCNRMSVLGVLGSDIGTGFNITTTSVSKHRRNNKAENNDDLHMFPLFDDKCPADVRARDIIMNRIGNIVLMPDVLAFKFLRVFLRRPWLIIPAVLWCLRIIARAKGIWNIIRHGGIRPVTVVMHRFMDAEDVRTAWDLMEQGVVPTDDRVTKAGPRIQETIERLQACSYGMAHPDTQQVVPACVQHSVFDPDLNVKLASTLPLKEKANAAEQADMQALWRRQQHQQQQHQQQQQQWQQQQQ